MARTGVAIAEAKTISPIIRDSGTRTITSFLLAPPRVAVTRKKYHTGWSARGAPFLRSIINRDRRGGLAAALVAHSTTMKPLFELPVLLSVFLGYGVFELESQVQQLQTNAAVAMLSA